MSRFLNSKPWKTLRKAVIERDGSQCFLCGSTDRLCVHHIYPEKRFKEFLLEPNNLITLCSSCHVFSKESQHHGIGQLVLYEKLIKLRKAQYTWLVAHLPLFSNKLGIKC